MTPSNTSELTMFLAELDNTNYYNNQQNIVRIKMGISNVKYYDIPLLATTEYPNPLNHYVLVIGPSIIFEEKKYAILPNNSRLKLAPGYFSETSLATIPNCYCWLVSKKIKNNTTNYNVGQIGNFNTTAQLPSDNTNIRYSLSPGINKSYTTTKMNYDGDINNDNIGIFITDNSIMLKSAGGSIVLGPDGISLLGERTETQTTGSFGLMQKNPIGTLIPETLVSPFAIEYLPNIDMILAIGNASRLLLSTTQAMGSVTNVVSSLK